MTAILGTTDAFCIHVTRERLVIGVPCEGFQACSKEEQVLLYWISGIFWSNRFNFSKLKEFLFGVSDKNPFNRGLRNLFLPLHWAWKALSLYLSQLFVELNECTHLRSRGNVTFSLLIVKIAGRTIWLDTNSVWMLSKPLERYGLALAFQQTGT